MKQKMALLLAFLFAWISGSALAESFTPITVDGNNYLSNIDVCIAAIDQTVLGSGESFSFNALVGRRSEERGYCAAPNGRGVDVVGGGVGQVATAVYLAVKYMDDMEVVEKSVYGSDFCAGYVPDEADAVMTDYDQNVDFRFINHGAPVQIRLWRDEDGVYCSISDAGA